MTRAERYAQCKALRDEGLLLREIASQLGLAISTVHDVLVDPTGARVRERKQRYAHPCLDCGTTVNSNGNRVIERCAPCDHERQRTLGRRYVIDSMQEWHRRYGAPPSAYDWNPWHVRYKGFAGSQWRVKRYEEAGRPWPAGFEPLSPSDGTWNDGLRADYALGHAGKALRDEEQTA